MMTFRANSEHLVKAGGKKTSGEKTAGGTTQNVVDNSEVKTPVKILQLLATNPQMTLSDVAAEIGKSVRAVERASAKLVEAGHLKYVGPKKGGHWEVKGDDHE